MPLISIFKSAYQGQTLKLRFADFTLFIKELAEGVYLTDTLNLSSMLNLPSSCELFLFPQDETWISSYGVADNHHQVLDHVGRRLAEDARWFVISMTPIFRENEPAEGGWRWAKHGEYIGTRIPQADYLVDEPHIDMIYVFYIIQIPVDQHQQPLVDAALLHEGWSIES